MSRETIAGAPRLDGWRVIVTGAGRGVGIETARHLALLGATVIIAERDQATGSSAEAALRAECGEGAGLFVQTDVGDADSLQRLADAVAPIDAVVNNATVTPLGPVTGVPLDSWDLSYRVNLRGPVELARLTLPGMIERGRGAFVAVSSVGGAYMAPYEALKAAQVELASALADELEGTGVHAFSIGPGQVETPGLAAGLDVLAPLYGMTVDEFKALNADHLVSAEEAGAGIAVAVALAERFHGTETSSLGALGALTTTAPAAPAAPAAAGGETLARIITDLRAQAAGWRERNVFERKWMERDFRKHTGSTPDELLEALGSETSRTDALRALDEYYVHYEELARGNVRDPGALAEALGEIARWRTDIASLRAR